VSFLLKSGDVSPLAAAIRSAIGASNDEDVEVETPQFHRLASDAPPMLPPSETDVSAWLAFLKTPREDLRAWGCRPFCGFTGIAPTDSRVRSTEAQFWEVEDGESATHELWLFPGEWYSMIPNGFPLVDINGVNELFIQGQTDDDIRCGCLAYGVMIPVR
jgi:hypothetical protein